MDERAAQRAAARKPILLVIGATLCFAALDAVIKHLSQTYPVPILVWARYAIQALALVIWIGPRMGLAVLTTSNLTSQIFRGVILIASTLCFITALKSMPLAEATSINYSTPTLVTVMAVVFLDERMTRERVAFVVSGLVGMLLIVRPGSEMFQGAALLALAAAWFYATFQIVTRKLAGEDWRSLMLYPALIGTVMMSVFMPFAEWPQTVLWTDAALLVGAGIVATIGHSMFVRAFQMSSASAITPFTYVQLVWATLIGWVAFGAFPGLWTLLGMAIITGSGLLIMFYEQRKARDPAAAEPTAVD